jgi:hypothetical protein
VDSGDGAEHGIEAEALRPAVDAGLAEVETQ